MTGKLLKEILMLPTQPTYMYILASSIAQLLRRLSPDVAHKFPDRESLIRSFTASGGWDGANSLKLNKELFIGT